MPPPPEPVFVEPRSDAADLAALLGNVARKDRAAFDAFYDATSAQVLSLALRITRQPETADEVVNDVYLQVWRHAERFESSRGNATAWLTTICRSRSLDALRRAKAATTSRSISFEEAPEPAQEAYSQDLLLAVEQRSMVHKALSQLDAGQRELLDLAYFLGYSQSELAEVTGKPLGTVKTQMRRALNRLKELLADQATRETS